ncbi:hypothetical protein U1Q18_009587 [Sarracenia purpurea var. burkii]
MRPRIRPSLESRFLRLQGICAVKMGSLKNVSSSECLLTKKEITRSHVKGDQFGEAMSVITIDSLSEDKVGQCEGGEVDDSAEADSHEEKAAKEDDLGDEVPAENRTEEGGEAKQVSSYDVEKS